MKSTKKVKYELTEKGERYLKNKGVKKSYEGWAVFIDGEIDIDYLTASTIYYSVFKTKKHIKKYYSDIRKVKIIEL